MELEDLADLAGAIRDRIKTALTIETESGPLTKLMKAFQEALIHDLQDFEQAVHDLQAALYQEVA